ncbi:MAG: hypothetical protein Q4F27_04625, partial [Desulfovibrionaceae bacterium]|nr:hypothetical protein [Desulfovibrionaceae bacterium]
LFVGTEIAAVGYRLDAHPTPLQMVAYRKAKEDFFAALPRSLQQAALYRPYFDVPGSLQDAPWLLPRFPLLRLCTGPLLPQILACRLLVLDHHGTTLLEAMTAGIPCICYWQREAWPLTPEGEDMLDELAGAGIWYATPQAAAEAAQRIWEAGEDWWAAPARQAARRKFRSRYALTVERSENPLWLQTLKNL